MFSAQDQPGWSQAETREGVPRASFPTVMGGTVLRTPDGVTNSLTLVRMAFERRKPAPYAHGFVALGQ
jgi:hypothetical protein